MACFAFFLARVHGPRFRSARVCRRASFIFAGADSLSEKVIQCLVKPYWASGLDYEIGNPSRIGIQWRGWVVIRPWADAPSALLIGFLPPASFKPGKRKYCLGFLPIGKTFFFFLIVFRCGSCISRSLSGGIIKTSVTGLSSVGKSCLLKH